MSSVVFFSLFLKGNRLYHHGDIDTLNEKWKETTSKNKAAALVLISALKCFTLKSSSQLCMHQKRERA